ncbi:photosystem II 10 kDa polypeptide, chloroplastic-like [Miscanthus floridulus]|uniref:photosystem II 10 kDa polypeptide, chloroplastic-like n=1 Tax=Miscanthus floridulus TaxID=154761 RepID=UPI00345AA3F6
MAASVVASLSLKPSPFLDRSRFTGVQPSARSSTFRVMAKKTKKIQTSQPFGPAGGLNLKDGVDASGRPAKGKGVYQFANKYGANVDGYCPIYNPEEWSPSGDVYVGGKTGFLLWAVTLAGILLGGALLVYNTSALAS